MIDLIELKNIFFVANKKTILSNICLKIKSKYIITLLGPNGAGKSTLVRIILRLIEPNSGKVKYCMQLRIGYVPQKLRINSNLPLTVNRFMQQRFRKNNLNILSSLKIVKADHLKNYLIKNLSPGEMQRVLFANALLNDPHVLILDEPTQGVDIHGKIFLYELIDTLRKKYNIGILLVSHNLNLVMAKTDYVICLNKHICCSGTPKKVSQNPIFNEMFGYNLKKKFKIYFHNHMECQNMHGLFSKKNKI